LINKIYLSEKEFKLVKTNSRIGRKLKKIYWRDFNNYLETREDMWDKDGYCNVKFEDFINWLRNNKGVKVKVLSSLKPNQKAKKDFAF